MLEIDIKKKITSDFGKDAQMATIILEKFKNETKLSPRVLRCIIVLAHGDINELMKVIKEAETDWRDVINYAESKEFEFNSPFQ